MVTMCSRTSRQDADELHTILPGDKVKVELSLADLDRDVLPTGFR